VLKVSKYNSLTFFLPKPNKILSFPKRQTSQTTYPAWTVWVSRKLRPETLEKLRPSGVTKTQTPAITHIRTQSVFVLFVTTNDQHKNVSRKTYFIALRELSLITSHCDGERSPGPPPRYRHERAAEIEPTLHLGKTIGTGSTGFNIQEAEEQCHNSTYIQHKLT